MATTQITFPDSGKTVEIERVSFLTLSLLRAHYEREYEGKPAVPMLQIDDTTEPNPNDEAYKKALSLWETKMRQAQWLASKVLFAKGVVTESIDADAVQKAIDDVAPFMNLEREILDGYKELGVPFDMQYMNAYIYLFHVCITNASEQSLLQTEMISGSGAASEAVQNAVFRVRTQI
jgi:hypothetical protein